MEHLDTILGKAIPAPLIYSPEILHPIARDNARNSRINNSLKHIKSGWDDWIHYELAWCDAKGCPQSGILLISVPWTSNYIIESKSLKLYLNSFNFTKFINSHQLLTTIQTDLEKTLTMTIKINLFSLDDWIISHPKQQLLNSILLDNYLTEYVETAEVQLQSLTTTTEVAQEKLLTSNFRSNCPVTGQPDWASIVITYKGPRINRAGVYQYLLSYRRHQGFHEQCIEQIFSDILQRCKPESLEVRGYFTRRGGLDINPIRSTHTYNKSPALNLPSRQ